ncbi:sensor domain-containing protein [Mycobacterium sp. DSM 3803]|nr:sensor domain-containing protein [Mycobacterium sp. DSM 3803]
MDGERRAGRKLAVALVALLALSGCAPQHRDTDGPEVDVLGSMMASESEINAIMGSTTIRPKTALRAPMKNDNYEPLSRPECIVVIGNAMDWVYRDSGYDQFREVQLADDADDVEVDQAIATFDSPKAANALVARTVDIWTRCGGDTLTFSYDGGETQEARIMATPSVVDGINLTHDQPVDPEDRLTHRAILALNNIVVDLRVSGYAIDDAKTVQLAKAIASRNAL